MTFLAPAWLMVAGLASAMVVGLHLFTRLQPRRLVLPTARFVPDTSLRTPSRSARLSDLLLLALRVLALLLAGVALARPSLSARLKPVATIILADRAADSADVAERTALIEADTIIQMRSLSSGLIAARRAGAAWSTRADSVELVIVTGLASGLWDRATADIRATWPGRIRIDTVPRRPAERPRVELSGGDLEAVRAAIHRLGREIVASSAGKPATRLLAAESGRIASNDLVALATLSRVAGLPAEPSDDMASAVYAGDVALVGPVRRGPSPAGDPIAWFADGSVAAAERPLGVGCERDVAFSLDAGDQALRTAGLRIIERLIAPCGAGWTPEKYQRLDSARIAVLAGTGGRATSADLRAEATQPPAWLPLLLAVAVLAGERILSRRSEA